jgi:replication factor A1
MLVKDLRPNTKVEELVVEVVSVSEARKFATAKGSGVVASAAVKDESGEVKMSLWNEQIQQVKEGDKLRIENGWCSEFRDEKQVSTGKFGTLAKIEE